MALIDCAECGGKISDQADTCPHCGAKTAKKMEMERRNIAAHEWAERERAKQNQPQPTTIIIQGPEKSAAQGCGESLASIGWVLTIFVTIPMVILLFLGF